MIRFDHIFKEYEGHSLALDDVSAEISDGEFVFLIGPSGAGKTTLLRLLIRDMLPSKGNVVVDDTNVGTLKSNQIHLLRRKVGMIFQRPTPFPLSVFENVAYGLKLHYRLSRREIAERVEKALTRAVLWEEVKDILDEPATALSGGQQQRLCIARAIAVEPEVLLMDEPTSAIDPVATAKIEELMESLKPSYTIVIVTHNMQQAARISDFTAFFYEGYIIEYGVTRELFTKPTKKQTENYITGRFG